jgi:hypothetical protein
MQQRDTKDESQLEEAVAQLEEANVSGKCAKGISGEARPSAEQSSSLSQLDFNLSKDDTPPASDQPRFSTPTKSLAQMAVESLFSIDLELIMAQGTKEESTDDEVERSPVSSGIKMSIPHARELPEEVKAMLGMNSSNVSSPHYDDSRPYESVFFGTDGSSSGIQDKSCSSWSSKEISALSQGSFASRLSPSKKDMAHSSPCRTKIVLNVREEVPAVLKESREVYARIFEKMRALDIAVDDDADDDEMSARILEFMNAMEITVDDDTTNATDVGSSAIFWDPVDTVGPAGGATEEGAPSISERAKTIKDWSRGCGSATAKEDASAMRDDSGLFSPSFANSIDFENDSTIDLGNPSDVSSQESLDTPRQWGAKTALMWDSPLKETGGHDSVRFGVPMSFRADGGDNAAEPARRSVLDRVHAIEERKGGHGAHPRQSPGGKEAGSSPRNAKGTKHVFLQFDSREDEMQDLMTEASRLEYPEEWAERDPEVELIAIMYPSPDHIEPQASEESDVLNWHLTNVPPPPHDAKKIDAQDPFFLQGDPFAASNIAVGTKYDSKTFNSFAEETFAQDDSLDFQVEGSAGFFSPYGDETPKRNDGIIARPPTPPPRQAVPDHDAIGWLLRNATITTIHSKQDQTMLRGIT